MSKQKIEFRNFWHIIEPEKINEYKKFNSNQRIR